MPETDIVDSIMQYESGEMDQEEMIAFFQRIINNGMVWHLQGSYGRTAAAFIQRGFCTRAA